MRKAEVIKKKTPHAGSGALLRAVSLFAAGVPSTEYWRTANGDTLCDE